MFTGIISDIGILRRVTGEKEKRIEVQCALPMQEVALGESIACSGVCLTVVSATPDSFMAELSEETLTCTAPHMWEEGKRLNLERALQLSSRLSGHFVSGHVDGVAFLEGLEAVESSHILTFRAPSALLPFIAPKGSVTLDGVSLTVNRVEGAYFTVNIIPHTWQYTHFPFKQPGDGMNLEVDMIARYIARLHEFTRP